ncbi:MAG: hypothetical protein AABZ10_02515 [Nitrospirota bacterium]
MNIVSKTSLKEHAMTPWAVVKGERTACPVVKGERTACPKA